MYLSSFDVISRPYVVERTTSPEKLKQDVSIPLVRIHGTVNKLPEVTQQVFWIFQRVAKQSSYSFKLVRVKFSCDRGMEGVMHYLAV